MTLSRLLAGVVGLALAAAGRAADPPPDPAAVRHFETRVRPLLAEKCHGCHGAEKQKANLRLDSAAAVARGGDSGTPPVVAGSPARSLLLRAVRHEGDAPKMPPKGKLTDREVADLEAWVKAGAVFPAAKAVPADGRHWAFEPVADPPVPAVKDSAWPASPLDRFILAKLEEKGLRPAPPADKRTLLRRATFDLTGLPPTPEEIDTFLKDDSPAAFARVVDRLLASPAYGERWGRHWLDVARYADSNGLDENVAHGNAWRFRDYVIAAFNADLPFDRFVREQVAGDLLPAKDAADRRRQLVATGFLALGPKVLAEPDKKKMEMDIVDEQLDTLGRAFLGLTVGCARCHDHKFDPLTIEDYYGLAGVFTSTKTMESFVTIARWHENALAPKWQYVRRDWYAPRIARAKAKVTALTAKPEAGSKAKLAAAEAELAALEKLAPEPASAMGVTEGKVADTPVLRRGNHLTPGKVVPRRFPTVLAGEGQPLLPAHQSGRLELANWVADAKNPLTARVMVNRVWRWHFGRGIVSSVDNFGRLGEKPSHPELLDWLAARFVEDGWSVKALHRRIMLSATYQQSAARDPKADLADPDNRLLHRAPVRRLEAEAIRDSLLAVGGLLDRSAGGPAVTHVKNREFLFDHTSKDGTTYTSRRRSVYLPVIRNNLYDVFQLFDATDATVGNGDRATTTVATQALFVMNSDLVADAADGLAGKLLAEEATDAGRARKLYAVAYGRPPTDPEVARTVEAVAGFGADRRKAWALVCQVALAANEFVYVN